MIMKKDFYWDMASEEIGKQLIKYFSKTMRICEVGFSGGHFLQFLDMEGYKNLSGVEIRTEQYDITRKSFEEIGLQIDLINDNVLNIDNKYEALYSTGLLQCLNTADRAKMIEHLSLMAPLAIFVVPEIICARNLGSKIAIAVNGCEEYSTENLLWELSGFYQDVRSGVMAKEVIRLKDNFIYFVCKNI